MDYIYWSIPQYYFLFTPMLETLRQDRQFWTPEQVDELEHFFALTPFFAPLYEHQDFEEVASMLFYGRVPAG